MSWVFESCNKHISDMSRSLSINFYLRPCSIAIYGKFCLYCLYHFGLISGLLIVWFINYALSLKVSRYTNVVYIGVYLVLTLIERLFLTVSHFLSYFCWSVNYMSQVIKFHNFFLTCSETEARSAFEGF